MDAIGTIVSLGGTATAQSADGMRTLTVGSAVHSGEELHTEPGSHLEIRFIDQSVLSQGPDATITLDELVYDPAQPSASSMILELSKGTFRMVTGAVARENPDGVSLGSPLATIGIRGTGVDFDIGGPGGAERYGIFQYDQHDLVVTTPQGTSFITGPGIMLDVGADGTIGAPRPYTPMELQLFQAVAPITSIPVPVPGQEQEGGEEGDGDQGQGQDGEGQDGEQQAQEGDGEEGDGGEEQAEGEGEGEGEQQAQEGDGEEGDELAGLGDGEDTGDGTGDDTLGGADTGDDAADGGDTGGGDTGDDGAQTGTVLGSADGTTTTTLDTSGLYGTDTITGTSTTALTSDLLGTGTDPATSTGTTGSSVQILTAADLFGAVLPSFAPQDEVDSTDGTQTEDGDIDISVYTIYLGTSGADSIHGAATRDLMVGLDGADTLAGGDGDDFLVGDYAPQPETGSPLPSNLTVFDDTLFSTTGGDDVLIGGGGKDQFLSSIGNDVYIGDDTTATTSSNWLIYDRPEDIPGYSWGPTGVTVDLDVGTADATLISLFGYTGTYGTATDEWGNTDTLVGIDAVDGSWYKDLLHGDDNANTLNGMEDDDTLMGWGGDDSLYGGDGNDSMAGGIGNDSLGGGDGADTMFGGLGADSLWGDLGNDSMEGGGGDDSVFGDSGDDTLYGDDAANTTSGNDSIAGGAGADFIDGGQGNDSIFGDIDNDSIKGGAGDDTIDGGTGNDTVEGGDGADSLYGGAGEDWLSYSQSTAAVNVSLTNQSATGGHATGDQFSDFENVLGSDFGDTLAGNSGDNVLDGGTGNDLLDGEQGNDSLLGGLGTDLLDGASGVDTMYFGADSVADYAYWDDPTHGEHNERLYDFNSGQDVLTFRAATFGSMATGTLNAAYFASGDFGGAYTGSGAALGSNMPGFVVDSHDGGNGNYDLYFDSNGDDAGGEYFIATINGSAPTASDIDIVAARADVEALL